MNLSAPFHRASGGDDAARHRDRARRRPRLSAACLFRRCRRSIFRRFRCRRRCPAQAPTRSPPASQVRSSARSAASPHVTEMTSTSSHRQHEHHACSSTSTATSTARRATFRPRSTPRAPTCRRTCAATRSIARSIPPTRRSSSSTLTSKTMTPGQMYDAASNILQQRLSQLDGIGQVDHRRLGAARRARRDQSARLVQIWRRPRGRARGARRRQRQQPEGRDRGRWPTHLQIYTNDQATHAADYRPLVIAYRNGAPVRLTDVADVHDSVEDLRNEGLVNGKPGIIVLLFRQPGANIIETVDASRRSCRISTRRCRPTSTSR